MASSNLLSHSDLLRRTLLNDYNADPGSASSLPAGSQFVERLQAAVRIQSPVALGSDDIEGRRLLNSMSIVNVLIRSFEEPSDELDPHQLLLLFWGRLDGWLLHPDIAREIASGANLEDPAVAASLEDTLTRIHHTVGFRGARAKHAAVVSAWRSRPWPDVVREAGLLLADYLLIQQANVADLRRASRMAARCEPLGALLARMEEAGNLMSRSVVDEVVEG